MPVRTQRRNDATTPRGWSLLHCTAFRVATIFTFTHFNFFTPRYTHTQVKTKTRCGPMEKPIKRKTRQEWTRGGKFDHLSANFSRVIVSRLRDEVPFSNDTPHRGEAEQDVRGGAPLSEGWGAEVCEPGFPKAGTPTRLHDRKWSN